MRKHPCKAAGEREKESNGESVGWFSFKGPQIVDVIVCTDSSRAEEQIDRGGGVEVSY